MDNFLGTIVQTKSISVPNSGRQLYYHQPLHCQDGSCNKLLICEYSSCKRSKLKPESEITFVLNVLDERLTMLIQEWHYWIGIVETHTVTPLLGHHHKTWNSLRTFLLKNPFPPPLNSLQPSYRKQRISFASPVNRGLITVWSDAISCVSSKDGVYFGFQKTLLFVSNRAIVKPVFTTR